MVNQVYYDDLLVTNGEIWQQIRVELTRITGKHVLKNTNCDDPQSIPAFLIIYTTKGMVIGSTLLGIVVYQLGDKTLYKNVKFHDFNEIAMDYYLTYKGIIKDDLKENIADVQKIIKQYLEQYVV